MNGSNALRRLLRALVVIVLAAAAVFAWNATRPAPVAALLAAAESGRVETTVANTRAGSVAACRRAKLATPLGGRIEKLTVREGDETLETGVERLVAHAGEGLRLDRSGRVERSNEAPDGVTAK